MCRTFTLPPDPLQPIPCCAKLASSEYIGKLVMPKRLVSAAAVLLSLAAPGLASDTAPNTRTILVLDGSGSMWGQIEGRAKISIAQDVVADLLKKMSESTELGLTVYGHRRKGDCADIETVVAPARGTSGQVLSAVNSIKPKGKTPMTDAVIAAAKALRHTEEPATVILVSDGIETCAPDPCAAARALEEAGVDFTAHVVGFDVSDAEAIKQMRCIASETGGSFRTAKDADELGRALNEVTSARPATEPKPKPEVTPKVKLTGPAEAAAGTVAAYTIEGTGADNDFLAVFDETGEMISYKTRANGDYIKLQMPKATGQYELRVLSEGREDRVMARLSVNVVELEPALDAPASVPPFAPFKVSWVGPATEWDFLVIAKKDDAGGYLTASDYLVNGGNPIEMSPPDTPGIYELRYIYGENREILVRRDITVE